MNTLLISLLMQHEQWVKSMGKEGKQLIVKDQDLSGTNLANRELVSSVFLDVRLDHSDLRGADLSYSNLGYSSFKRADLSGVTIIKAEADHVDFEAATISNMNAFRTTFIGANFQNAILTGVNFSRCQLDHSNFSGAVVSGCCFFEADLRSILGLESMTIDWIDVGPEDRPHKLYGIQGIEWLLEASKK